MLYYYKCIILVFAGKTKKVAALNEGRMSRGVWSAEQQDALHGLRMAEARLRVGNIEREAARAEEIHAVHLRHLERDNERKEEMHQIKMRKLAK